MISPGVKDVRSKSIPTPHTLDKRAPPPTRRPGAADVRDAPIASIRVHRDRRQKAWTAPCCAVPCVRGFHRRSRPPLCTRIRVVAIGPGRAWAEGRVELGRGVGQRASTHAKMQDAKRDGVSASGDAPDAKSFASHLRVSCTAMSSSTNYSTSASTTSANKGADTQSVLTLTESASSTSPSSSTATLVPAGGSGQPKKPSGGSLLSSVFGKSKDTSGEAKDSKSKSSGEAKFSSEGKKDGAKKSDKSGNTSPENLFRKQGLDVKLGKFEIP
ncbi:hypothetical protein EVG20_g487 [Dentipellis fragilis]|uniref:Uncharacterized protein n=1 Tax=Dentipellis fragilis TaxID=205917 RepID=A0A4Y9ZDL6_9AGAM|nr:hypothetical protein EVG20_g487 [Dentipellis fragilis]